MHSTVSQIPTDLGVRAADVIDQHFSGKKLPKEVLLPITYDHEGKSGRVGGALHLLMEAPRP